MILRNVDTGMVLEQAQTERRGNGRQRGDVWWTAITGIVRAPGESKFKQGQGIAWPYHPDDWERLSEE